MLYDAEISAANLNFENYYQRILIHLFKMFSYVFMVLIKQK